jgi:hypothetical protein
VAAITTVAIRARRQRRGSRLDGACVRPLDGHERTHTQPPAGAVYFAKDFPAINDEEWGYPLGGFGGLEQGGPLHHTPVVFVHGNQADAQNWLDVVQQLQNVAGYTMQEMYALSYNGLENYYAGLPLLTAPSTLDTNYAQQNPTVLDNGCHGVGDDDEVPDLCRFVEAVQRDRARHPVAGAAQQRRPDISPDALDDRLQRARGRSFLRRPGRQLAQPPGRRQCHVPGRRPQRPARMNGRLLCGIPTLTGQVAGCRR